jgi:hypothetical protein
MACRRDPRIRNHADLRVVRPLQSTSSMRITIVALYALIAIPAIAGAESRAPALPDLAKPTITPSRTLEAAEVSAQMKPYGEAINHCYLDVARDVRGAGKLEITLTIHRTGKLDAVDVATPGLPARLGKRVAGCVKSLVEDASFPARKSSTTAIVPFFYQHTAAPNSGPQLSCWNPRGCR